MKRSRRTKYFSKIDVEGAEYLVLIGSDKVLTNGLIKYVQFEQHENDMRTDSSKEIIKFLGDRGYFRVQGINYAFGNFSDDIYQCSLFKI